MANEVTTGNSMLAPSNLEQAMKLADMMSAAKLVPAHLQGKPADCLLVIEQASRWKMSPFAVAQSTSVIQGKLMYEGKLVTAVVNANGGLTERLSFAYSGEGEKRQVIVSGKFKGDIESREVTVVFKDVKTANAMWQKQADQQLAYSGSRAWARRHAPELMLGVYSPEEFDESAMINITPSDVDQSKPKSPFKNASGRNLWCKNVQDSIKTARSTQELADILELNKVRFDEMDNSGAEADQLGLEGLRNDYALAVARLKRDNTPIEDLHDFTEAEINQQREDGLRERA